MSENEQEPTYPGPWVFHIGDDYTEFYCSEGMVVFTVRHQMEEWLARLIAAAPSMLGALTETWDYLVDTGDPPPSCGKAIHDAMIETGFDFDAHYAESSSPEEKKAKP